jgi:hypothetical protein
VTADEVRVLAANDAFYQAFATRDFGRMDDVWAAEHDVTCIHPGWSPLVGREAVMSSWRAILRSDNPRIEASAARAWVHGETAYVVCFEGTRGETPLLCATNYFVREQGAWKMVHHQAGHLAQAPEAATPGGGAN